MDASWVASQDVPMDLVLRALRVYDEAPVLAAHSAMAAEQFSFLLGYAAQEPFAEFVARLERQRVGQDVPTGWVASTYLVAEVAGLIVGRLSLRHDLTPFLRHVGGHIGFGVLPEHRGRGYATAMLREGLARARGLGLARALVTCDEPNVASRRVIERCGGSYEDTYRGDAAPLPVLRYWIDTAPRVEVVESGAS
jgi:predicted acetyltransferase